MLTKGKETKVTAELDHKALEDVLVEYKAGKKSLAQTVVDIFALHESTVRFAGFKQSETHLQMMDAHMDMFNLAVMQQHDDLQDVVKALKDSTKKK